MEDIFKQTLNTFVSLFVVIDPFAAVPIYLTLTDRFTPIARRRIRRRATLIATFILILFALFGLAIFDLFGITIPAFKIAGGILLLLLGISQIHADDNKVNDQETTESMQRNDISVFPLATPLLAGPATISTIALQSSNSTSWLNLVGLIVAIFAAMGAVYLVFRSATLINRVLGKTGLNLLTRIMGLLLTAIAVQFLLTGIQEALVLMQIVPVK